MFTPVDAEGNAIAPERLPLVVAIRERHPAQGTFSIRGLDGAFRQISVTAFPIEGQHGLHLGAVAFFREGGTAG